MFVTCITHICVRDEGVIVHISRDTHAYYYPRHQPRLSLQCSDELCIMSLAVAGVIYVWDTSGSDEWHDLSVISVTHIYVCVHMRVYSRVCMCACVRDEGVSYLQACH